MAAKAITAKAWELVSNYDRTLDSRYPAGDKPNPEQVVAPTIAITSMAAGSITISIADGANIDMLTPRRDGISLEPIATDSTAYEFTGLTPGAEYELELRADGSGGPLFSNTLTQVAVPAAPTLTASRVDDTTVRFTIEGGSGATGWTKNYRTPAGSGSYTSASIDVGTPSFDVTVSAGATAEAYITASNDGGSVSSNIAALPDEYTPFIERNFNVGPVGSSAKSEWDNGGAGSVYANADPFDGTTYINSTNVTFSENTNVFGGWLSFPQNLVQGDEIWVRLRVRPQDAFWSDSSPHQKFIRIRCETPTGSIVQGYIDIYINQDGTFKWIREIDGPWTNKWFYFDPSVTMDVGTWQTYETYVKLSADPNEAVVRFWKDGVLVGTIQNAGRATLYNATNVAMQLLIFTYWNGEPALPTEVHTCGIDSIKVATSLSPPTATDAAGNKFIGV